MPVVVDEEITDLQRHIYFAIVEAWEKAGEAPTQSELARAMPCSTGAVQVALKKLRQRGHVTSRKYEERSVKPVDMERVLIRYAPDPWADLKPAPKRVYWRTVNP